VASKFVEVCTLLAQKEVHLMRATAEHSYQVCKVLLKICFLIIAKEFLVATMKEAVGIIRNRIQQEDLRLQRLTSDYANVHQQLTDIKKRNEELAHKVSLYEDPELADEMEERIQMALDRKEKALQAELQQKLGKSFGYFNN
jgi:hypothetical protein